MSDKTNKSTSFIPRVWTDSWQWLQNTKLGFILAFVFGGMMGSIFVGNSLWQRVLAGLIGALMGVILLLIIVFIIHLIITPSRLRGENRHKFIEQNASYTSKIIGNPIKNKYLMILEILRSMVRIENEITDDMAGKHQLTNSEFNAIRKRFNQQAQVPLLPSYQVIKIYMAGDFPKKVNEVIKKLELQIMGDVPTENQLEFFIKTRSVLDDSDVTP